MVKRKALMKSILSNLHNFLKKTANNLSLTDKKFPWDGLVGLLRARQPIVCQMARHLPNQQTKFISRLDRLDQHLLKNSDFDDNVKEALPKVWLLYFQDDTPIILDLSDLAKRLAQKMDYLATVRDGSKGELVNGYRLLELYASLMPNCLQTCSTVLPEATAASASRSFLTICSGVWNLRFIWVSFH